MNILFFTIHLFYNIFDCTLVSAKQKKKYKGKEMNKEERIQSKGK